MIVVPYSTDAPLYHLPIGTASIIVINIVVFCVTTLQLMLGNVALESIEWLMLDFSTINPMQWVTAAFMHADFFHLIGNMIFLFAFGLIVEGKVGFKVFSILYLVLCLFDGAMSQIPMFVISGEGGALGASGVIFALMIIAAIWAPENEMDCFYWVGVFFIGTFEIRLVKLCGIFLLLQVLFLWLSGFSMSSEMLHLIGAAAGVPVACVMLRQGWVDCEGWDLVSRNGFLQQSNLLCSPAQRNRIRTDKHTTHDPVGAALKVGRHVGEESNPIAARKAAVSGTTVSRNDGVNTEAADEPRSRSGFRGRSKANKKSSSKKSQSDATTLASRHPDFKPLASTLTRALKEQDLPSCVRAFTRLDEHQIAEALPEDLLFGYVSLIGQRKEWSRAVRPLAIIGAAGGHHADDAWLRLAQIQISVMKQPAFALKTLAKMSVNPQTADPAEQKQVAQQAKLASTARQALGGMPNQ